MRKAIQEWRSCCAFFTVPKASLKVVGLCDPLSREPYKIREGHSGNVKHAVFCALLPEKSRGL